MRLLLVEDTGDVADAISASFERAGIACDIAPTLADGQACLDVQRYDVVVLDIHLPDGLGTDILLRLRRNKDTTPVLMLTAQFAVDDRITALNQGADDYLVKPFDLRELEARVRALVRRDQNQKGAEIAIARLAFDPAAKVVRIDGSLVTMTRREMALLNIFMRNPGAVLSKERLFDGLFSFEDSEVSLNAVELYVGRLRKKLVNSGTSIETLRGLGYRLNADA
ncbi:response regulator [Actibacterium lipolyticum]|uniref:Transcriptional regulatory protein BasR n=1 Tax=Actibacterium lipolyticum TaxID=1524263 RepID=A0A238KFD0_9RHOB|nr:response regulator transcription factor [Actibacterium lipolyticum]SMX41563.1 Transcriptional regulatory protein BasR [Actibacterium lipolyticum]